MMTAECVTRDQLQEYLTGWSAPDQSEAIEAHLRECSICEQVAAKIENDSDSLLASLRRSQTEPQQGDLVSAEVMAAALNRVKQAGPASEASEGEAESRDQWSAPCEDIGSYELLQPIGHGGMGSVYLARHRQLGKRLAIKLLSPRLNRNGGYTARFQREMRAAGGLDHPAIVRATDAGEHNGTHYLAMEYIEGLDLSRIARLLGRFSIADACEVGRQVALGLSHAHAAGVTHRDIKPSNIMLSSAGQVKILDFGLARLNLWDEASAELTTVGQLIGTLDYMAPEQADRPESVDYRADLYALGATLFRLLCGRAPLAASPEMSPLAKLRLLATHQPPSLATLRPDAPEALVRLVGSLLARDPELRPASAAHVAEELATLAQGSDLPSLVARAQADSQTDSDGLTAELASGTLQSLHSFNGTATEAAADAAKPPRRRWRLAEWALAPMAILAGVLITLETQKGTLVIESEAADVTVKLLRDGKAYEQFKVVPGANSTRLYAGQYEVTIDGGSDSLVVDKDRIEVRRGETTIAHIHQQPALVVGSEEAASSTTQPETPLDRDAEIASLQQRLSELQGTKLPGGEEQLYDGKPLSYWLDVVGREKSEKGYQDALTALQSMVTPENGERISEVLLQALRNQSESRTSSALDRLAFSIVKSANPGAKFYEVLIRELQRDIPAWQTRILSGLTNSGRDDPKSIAPLTNWLEENAFASDKRSQLVIASADYYQELIEYGFTSPTEENPSVREDAREHYAKVLVDCKALDDSFWLRQHSFWFGTGRQEPYRTWHPTLGNHIEQVAIRTLGDPKADRKLLAQAIVILSVFHSNRYDRAGMKETRPELVEAIRALLDRWHSHVDEIYASQKMEPKFKELLTYLYFPNQIFILPLSRVEDRRVAAVSRFDPPPMVWPSYALLFLVRELDAGAELKNQLIELFEATSQLNAELFAMLGPPRASSIPVQWPTLEVMVAREDAAQHLKAAKPAHWLAALLHYESYQLLPADARQQVEEAARARYLPAYAAQLMQESDTNGDGQVSTEEIKKAHPHLQNADADGDQQITLEEMLEFLNKRPKDGEGTNSGATKPSEPAGPAATDTPKPATADGAQAVEPLYKGRPLSSWLETLDREISFEGYEESLGAINAMLKPENAQQITGVLLKVLRRRADQPQSFKLGNRIAFPILQRANPGRAFYELLAEELEKGSSAWQVSLLESLAWVQAEDSATIAPLTEWLEKNVFSKQASPELLRASKDYYLLLIHRKSSLGSDIKEHFAAVLINCGALDDAAWLSRPIFEDRMPSSGRAASARFNGNLKTPLKTWYPPIGDHIEQVAIRIVRNNQADRRLFAQALVTLRTLNSSRYDRSGMSDKRTELIDALRAVMKQWQAKADGLFESQNVESEFYEEYFLRVEKIQSLSPSFDGMKSRNLVGNASTHLVNLSVEVLSLINELQAGADFREELVWVFESTAERNAKLYNSSEFGLSRLALMWPELNLHDLNAPSTGADQSIASENDQEITREDWLAAWLHTTAYQALPAETQGKLKGE